MAGPTPAAINRANVLRNLQEELPWEMKIYLRDVYGLGAGYGASEVLLELKNRGKVTTMEQLRRLLDVLVGAGYAENPGVMRLSEYIKHCDDAVKAENNERMQAAAEKHQRTVRTDIVSKVPQPTEDMFNRSTLIEGLLKRMQEEARPVIVLFPTGAPAGTGILSLAEMLCSKAKASFPGPHIRVNVPGGIGGIILSDSLRLSGIKHAVLSACGIVVQAEADPVIRMGQSADQGQLRTSYSELFGENRVMWRGILVLDDPTDDLQLEELEDPTSCCIIILAKPELAKKLLPPAVHTRIPILRGASFTAVPPVTLQQGVDFFQRQLLPQHRLPETVSQLHNLSKLAQGLPLLASHLISELYRRVENLDTPIPADIITNLISSYQLGSCSGDDPLLRVLHWRISSMDEESQLTLFRCSFVRVAFTADDFRDIFRLPDAVSKMATALNELVGQHFLHREEREPMAQYSMPEHIRVRVCQSMKLRPFKSVAFASLSRVGIAVDDFFVTRLEKAQKLYCSENWRDGICMLDRYLAGIRNAMGSSSPAILRRIVSCIPVFSALPSILNLRFSATDRLSLFGAIANSLSSLAECSASRRELCLCSLHRIALLQKLGQLKEAQTMLDAIKAPSELLQTVRVAEFWQEYDKLTNEYVEKSDGSRGQQTLVKLSAELVQAAGKSSNSAAIACALQLSAAAFDANRHYADAHKAYSQALSILRSLLGNTSNQHLAVILLQLNDASVLSSLKDEEEAARQLYCSSLTSLIELCGKSDLDVAIAHINFGEHLAGMKLDETAETQLRLGLAVRQHILGDSNYLTVRARVKLAQFLRSRSRMHEVRIVLSPITSSNIASILLSRTIPCKLSWELRREVIPLLRSTGQSKAVLELVSQLEGKKFSKMKLGSADQLRCPSGHELTVRSSLSTSFVDVVCDFCGAEATNFVPRCISCSFDMCWDCVAMLEAEFRKPKSLQPASSPTKTSGS